jgi:hypothetical protein
MIYSNNLKRHARAGHIRGDPANYSQLRDRSMYFSRHRHVAESGKPDAFGRALNGRPSLTTGQRQSKQ